MRNWFLLLSIACIGCAETPPPATMIEGPILEVTLGSTEDVTLMDGQLAAEIFRFRVRNLSDEAIDLSPIAARMYRYDRGVPDDVSTLLSQVTLVVDGAPAPPPLIVGTSADSVDMEFGTLPSIRSGATREFVFRADVRAMIETRVDFFVGDSARGLVTVDLGGLHRVLDETQVIGNDSALRRVRILPRPIPGSGDAVAVVATFGGTSGFLLPGSWPTLGSVCLTSYGNDAHVTMMQVVGEHLEMFRLLSTYDEALGRRSEAAVTETNVMIPVDEWLEEGVTRCLSIVGEFASHDELLPLYGTRTSISIGHIAAETVDGEHFEAIVNRVINPEFVLHNSSPYVTVRPPPTTVLVDGLDEEIYSFEVSAAFGRQVNLASLTFRAGAAPGRSLSDFRLFAGATEVDPASYRIVRTGTTEDLRSGTLTIGMFAEQFSVVFPDGHLVLMGELFHVRATPEGFSGGDFLSISFGDQFSSLLPGEPQADGRIMYDDGSTGGPVNEAIVWNDFYAPTLWFGSWNIRDLYVYQSFTF